MTSSPTEAEASPSSGSSEQMEPADYCALLCREPDRLRLVNAHEEVVEVVRGCLGRAELPFTFYYKSRATCAFKLAGSPFAAAGCSQEVMVQVRRALASVIRRLASLSWHTVTASDLGKERTHSCLFFRKIVVADQAKQSKLARDGEIFTWAPSGRSSLLMIDVPPAVEAELVAGVAAACAVTNHRQLEAAASGTTSKLSLGGVSWAAAGDSAIAVRRVIMEVIRAARRHKFELVTNLNLTGTADSLLFQHKASLQDAPEDMFLISLNRDDRLRLVAAPSYVVTATEEVVAQLWGVQGCKERGADCYEFKLYGRPWWADGEDAVKARHLVASVLARYKALGWEVAAAADLSRRQNDKTVFVLRQCPPEQQDWAVLSCHESDKLRLLSSCDTFQLEDGVARILEASQLTQAITYYWKAKQWKLKGVPFSGNSTFGADQRLVIHLLTRILRHFHRLGWRLVASADVCAKYQSRHNSTNNLNYPLDTHSWFFLHDPDSVIVSDTVLDIEAEDAEELQDDFGDQFAVEEIKSEKSQMRYIIRVVLPAAFILCLTLYYIFSILL